MKIKKNDIVAVIAGKNRGKTGKVLKSIPESGRIFVEGVNIYKKHVKPKKQGEKGQTVMVPRSLHVSNVQIQCPSCSKAVRVGTRVEGKQKERFCKRCKAKI